MLAQLATELRLTARRGENVLVTAVIPAVVLLFFASVPVLDLTGDPVATLLPGAIALAVIATGLVSLGIATAYERHYGVLKRLGGSPLGRSGLVAAKLGAVAVVEMAQVALLVAIALLLGWRPGPSIALPVVAAALVVGTAAFAGLGLLLAGSLRAEAVLALANALFLGFLLVGGILVPAAALPGPLALLAPVLPSGALADALRAGLEGGEAATPLAILAVWAVAAVGLTVRGFRWE